MEIILIYDRVAEMEQHFPCLVLRITVRSRLAWLVESSNNTWGSTDTGQGQVIEKVRSKDPFVLRARESMLIRKFDTYRRSLNKESYFISSLKISNLISFRYWTNYVYLIIFLQQLSLKSSLKLTSEVMKLNTHK